MSTNTNNLMIDLNHLLLIPAILEELKELREFKNSFFKEKEFIKTSEVMEILGLRSRVTIKNYIDNYTFTEGEHYVREGGKIKFVHKEILKFKNKYSKNSKSLHRKTAEQIELEQALERLVAWIM